MESRFGSGVLVGTALVVAALLATRIRGQRRRQGDDEGKESVKKTRYTYRTVPLDPQKHYEGMLEIARNTYGGHDYIPNEFYSWFDPKKKCITLGLECVERDGELAGIYVLRPDLNDHVGCMEALRVHPRHREQGLAHRLQREMIAETIKRKKELGDLRILRYTVYDENYPSLKVAKQSGMVQRRAFPYFMVTEEPDPDSVYLRRTGPGAIRRLLDECLVALEQFGNKEQVRKLENVSDVYMELAKQDATVLFQDWKPFTLSEDNVAYLMKKNHEAVRTNHGASFGVIRPDAVGTICVATHYSRNKVDPAEDMLRHLAYWLGRCDSSSVPSFYWSYPAEAHPKLKAIGIVDTERPQVEYNMELDI